MSCMKFRTITTVILAMASLAAAQTPAQNRGVRIRVGQPTKAPPPQPEPGDVLRIDENGDVLIDVRRASGDIESHRIPRRTKVAPEITTEVDLVSLDRVRYSYQVSNSAAARQNIETIAIGAHRPRLITILSDPPSWKPVGPSAGPPWRYVWGSLERSTDIAPGSTVGPFEFETPMLPGLSKAYVEGYLSTDEASISPHEWGLSRWLYGQLSEALLYENNTVQPAIVGPKLEIASIGGVDQLAEAIAEEFVLASQMPEFRDHQVYLENTGSYLKGAGKAAAGLRRQLSEMGGTSLHKSFFRAMALNLEFLEKLR